MPIERGDKIIIISTRSKWHGVVGRVTLVYGHICQFSSAGCIYGVPLDFVMKLEDYERLDSAEEL